jgi:hypothetical protein
MHLLDTTDPLAYASVSIASNITSALSPGGNAVGYSASTIYGNNSSMGWDTLAVGDGHLLGTFHADFGLSSAGSTYVIEDWTLSFALEVQARGGIARLDPPTTSLTDVTFTDGTTPESLGYQVSFGSGLQTVPEPNSLALFAISGICLYTYARRLKWLTRTASSSPDSSAGSAGEVIAEDFRGCTLRERLSMTLPSGPA